MTTATCEQVARDTRKPGDVTKPKRTVRWVQELARGPIGGEFGLIRLTVGDVQAHYAVQLLNGGGGYEEWAVQKEREDGTYAESYRVCVPTAPGGAASCTCRAYEFCKDRPRHCRHTDSLAAALRHRG